MQSLSDTIELASKELSEQSLCDSIDSCERELKAKLHSIKYNAKISKKIELPELNAKMLYRYFINAYTKQYGTITTVKYWDDTVRKIAAVLSHDINEAEKLGVDVNKGIKLIGGVGVGKTSIMKTFANVLSIYNSKEYPTFITANTNNISNEYAKKDNALLTINRYSNEINEGLVKHGGWFFDDLGNENEASNFGNKSNVMEEIIQLIYNKKHMIGKTHISTNLSVEDLQDKYGERVLSRIKEMYNIIVFPSSAKDMRI